MGAILEQTIAEQVEQIMTHTKSELRKLAVENKMDFDLILWLAERNIKQNRNNRTI